MIRERLEFLWSSASDGITMSSRIFQRRLTAVEIRVKGRIVVLKYRVSV